MIVAKCEGIIPAVSFGSLVGWLNGRLVQSRNSRGLKSIVIKDKKIFKENAHFD